MAQVSIIVPVYQVEAYLSQCIESVLSQSFTDWELILVDDGSRDRSGAICDEYAQKDGRVLAVHTENQGPGPARNRGMAHSSGQYICFLDADDLMDGTDALARLVTRGEETQGDIIVGNYRRFSEAGTEEICRHGLSDTDCFRCAEFRYRGFYLTGNLAFNWGKLYRKSFLVENHLVFQNFRLAEDKLFNICCYACCPRYSFLEESVVRYRRTENSLTGQLDPLFSEKWVGLMEAFSDFLRERQIPEAFEDITAFHLFYGSFFLVEQGVRHQERFSAIVKRLRAYGKYDAVKQAMAQLAKGKHLSAIPSVPRRVITWGSAAAFTLGAYGLFAAATGLFVKARF